MLGNISTRTDAYKAIHNKRKRKEKGQFFTSERVAEYMAKMASSEAKCLSVLDPGAGNGILATSIVEYCISNNMCNSFKIDFVENDSDVMDTLSETVSELKEYVSANGGKVEIRILNMNYITDCIESTYDIIICNPPYMKLRKNSKEAEAMSQYIYGQPNLYSLFMAKSIELLRDSGRFVFIVPRSWTSGSYYRKIRKYILYNLDISDLLIFKNRCDVFENETVLQETMIISGKKSNKQKDSISIHIADGYVVDNEQVFNVKTELIKGIGREEDLLLPSDEGEMDIIENMASIHDTFDSLGYIFKTGPVVEFRNESDISVDSGFDMVPMYRASNIVRGKCVFPVKIGKAQYVSKNAKNLLLKNENTVFLKRLSAKEESRRLQSCVYIKQDDQEYMSVENHVNYLQHKDGTPISIEEAEWINDLLMSDEYDVYFRMISGSTQVNAGDLNYLPVKRREAV